jgi:hypothetical protein
MVDDFLDAFGFTINIQGTGRAIVRTGKTAFATGGVNLDKMILAL